MLKLIKRKLQGLFGGQDKEAKPHGGRSSSEPPPERHPKHKDGESHEGRRHSVTDAPMAGGHSAAKGHSHAKAHDSGRRHDSGTGEDRPRKPQQDERRRQERRSHQEDRRQHSNEHEPKPEHYQHRPHAKKAPLQQPALVEPPPAEGKVRFFDFDIANEVLCGIQDLGFEYCTPIQTQCVPESLKGRDVLGKAQTGTGKTAAFLTSAFTRMLKSPRPQDIPGACRMLVLAPTRELAIQIHKDAEDIGKYCGFNNLVVFGGMDHKQQRNALNDKIDLLVGTPGRIIDYMRSGHLKLMHAEILVIDEADRMLDMGFIPDVRRIVAQLPPTGKRQTMLFSATLTQDIMRLAGSWLKDPLFIEIEPDQVVAGSIDQKFYIVSTEEKLPALLWILRNEKVDRMLIFVNRKDFTGPLSSTLRDEGFRCEQISGDIPQDKRLKILARFRSGETPIIVATDVAARGIHVDNISHVVNYDMPHEPQDYVHRIGRTGRAGKVGQSVSLLCEYGAHLVPELEKLLGKEIPCVLPPEEMVADKSRTLSRRPHTGGHHSDPRHGGRHSGGRRPPGRDRRPRPRR